MIERLKRKVHKLISEVRFNRYYDVTCPHNFDHTFERLKSMQMMGFSPKVIIDVGASNGRWSQSCMRVFPSAKYFGVEPLDENKTDLDRFKSKNKNFDYWLGCLGSRTEIIALNVDGAGTSILPGHWGNPYGVERKVPVETLDNIITQGLCPPPDLIKLDVQGYELEVLKGSANALSSAQAIITETSFFSFQSGMPIFHEVTTQLALYGFVLYDVLSLKLRPLDSAAGQSDLLFLKERHPLRLSNKWDHSSVY